MSIVFTSDTSSIDPGVQRQVFGALPTGVTAITGLTVDGAPRGFVVGTFQSLSLEPPLVTFCVDKSSSTWPTLRSLGRFTANILSTEQLPVCQALARKGDEKFRDVAYETSPLGTPRIAGAIAWIDCEVLSEVVAGDHYVIVGSIEELVVGDGDALMFRGGKFGEFNLWQTPDTAESTPETKTPRGTTMLQRVTDAWARAWGDGETAAFEQLVADDYVRHSKSGEESLTDVLTSIGEQHAAFSDFSVRVLQAIEDDNLVAIHWESTGTHSGEFMGVPATGRTVTVTGASFVRHHDGRITDEAVVWDPREMLSAVGIWHLGVASRRGA